MLDQRRRRPGDPQLQNRAGALALRAEAHRLGARGQAFADDLAPAGGQGVGTAAEARVEIADGLPNRWPAVGARRAGRVRLVARMRRVSSGLKAGGGTRIHALRRKGEELASLQATACVLRHQRWRGSA